MTTSTRKRPAPAVPKIAAGKGGARPGAGRKTLEELATNEYQVFNKAKAKRELYNARLAELKAKEKGGELIAADTVRAEWAQIVSNVRSKLLMMPAKLAATALGATTFAEMQDLLTVAVHEVLQELSENA